MRRRPPGRTREKQIEWRLGREFTYPLTTRLRALPFSTWSLTFLQKLHPTNRWVRAKNEGNWIYSRSDHTTNRDLSFIRIGVPRKIVEEPLRIVLRMKEDSNVPCEIFVVAIRLQRRIHFPWFSIEGSCDIIFATSDNHLRLVEVGIIIELEGSLHFDETIVIFARINGIETFLFRDCIITSEE